MTKKLDRDLIEHARDQLFAAARRHVHGGMGPASAAYAAIRETKALFPSDWKLAVQGDNDDEFVEVWEVDHKYGSAIASIPREPEAVKKGPSKRSHATKRRPYEINPASPDVIKAFMASHQPATEEGIQEFLAKYYGAWMQQYKKQRYRETDPSDIWDIIQREFTEALERHFKFED